MGLNKSKSLKIPNGVNNPGCLQDMYRKYGAECVDERVISKWHGWTRGAFPLSGTLSIRRLQECRAMMEGKKTHFKPELFVKWEKEANEREQKRRQPKEQKEQKACYVNTDKVTDHTTATHMLTSSEIPPPSYRDTPQYVFQAPIIQMPGPQGNLINVVRAWLPDELKSVAAALPRPEEGITAFVEAIRRMDDLYRPTTSEMAVVLSQKCASHWLQLRQHLPMDLERTAPAIAAQAGPPVVMAQLDGETRYQQALDNMFTALRASYTATEDWTKMSISQSSKETAREFLGRVSRAVSKHGGVNTTPEQKQALIRQYFILGGEKDVIEYVKNHLVTWSSAAPNELLQYAENFERIKEKTDQNKQNEIHEAALSFYLSSVQNGKSAHMGHGNGTFSNNTFRCWRCRKLGHIARNCMVNRGPRMSDPLQQQQE